MGLGVKEIQLASGLTYSEIVSVLRQEFGINEEAYSDIYLLDQNDERLGRDCFNLPIYVRNRTSNGKNRLYIATIG